MDKLFLEDRLEAGKSLEGIGREAGVHPSTVAYWLRKHGLEAVNRERHAPRGGIEREALASLVDAGCSIRQIATRLDVSAATVRHWLRRYGLRTTARREANPGRRVVECICPRHGKTGFVLRADGGRRCLRCRSDAVATRRRQVKAVLVAEAGGCCQLCGYDRYVGALEFHHIEPALKQFSLASGGIARSLERARAEARKCVLLCSNCHAEVEGGVKSLGR